MKNTIFLFICCVFAANLSATIHTVSNAPNIPAQFQTIQAAVDAAVAGDSILVEGSGIAYNAPTVSKKLVFIAPGFNPGSFNHKKVRLTGTFKLLTGADASVIMGFSSDGTGWTMEISCSDVRVEKNDFGLQFYNSGNPTVGLINTVSGGIVIADGCSGAIIQDNLIGYATQSAIGALSSIIIQHNIFLKDLHLNNSGIVISNLNGDYLFKNNIFHVDGYNINFSHLMAGITGVTFENNIFDFAFWGDFGTLSGCTFNNNMTNQTTYPIPIAFGANNLVGLVYTYEKYDVHTPFSQFDLHLKAGSAGKNAGTDGQDIGVQTASHPFSMTGEPTGIPVVRSITLSNENVAPNSSFQVKIVATKAKSN
jgi:hypothetical protein